MWGQAVLQFDIRGRFRIIPTRVGTRFTLMISERTCGDHPHACGDKHTPYLYEVINGRIIPTRVGTSIDFNSVGGTSADHPHACGDKFYFVAVTVIDRGSSPRVWGQVIGYRVTVNATGIIPTRVGTRCSMRQVSR